MRGGLELAEANFSANGPVWQAMMNSAVVLAALTQSTEAASRRLKKNNNVMVPESWISRNAKEQKENKKGMDSKHSPLTARSAKPRTFWTTKPRKPSKA